MLFTSLEFLLFFMPAVLLLHLILPKGVRNIFLCAASLFFYAWGEPTFLWVMLASVGMNYVLSLLISFLEGKRGKQLCLALAVLLNLGLLFVFKYANFVTGMLHQGFPQIPVTSIVLPIGISFFTFQAMSYVIDVYRGERAQKNPVSMTLYISLFPQLVAGPIVRYGDIARELGERRIGWEELTEGLFRFMRGFVKKMLLANPMATVADAAFSAVAPSTPFAWLGAIAYAFQIFFDFSGYSDMAIGLGRMLGFHFPENFDFPYLSKTVTEFWRRWHMTLGGWFRDYLYFPLGGSRVKSRWRLAWNLLLVWGATGLWHGANWTFLLWGMFYGVLIFFEKCVSLPQKVENNRKLGGIVRIGTLLAVLFGWVLFRAEGLSEAFFYVSRMLFFGGAGDASDALFYLREYFVIFVCCVLFSMPIGKLLGERFRCASQRLGRVGESVSMILLGILFAVGIASLVIDAHNPFIYFNF